MPLPDQFDWFNLSHNFVNYLATLIRPTPSWEALSELHKYISKLNVFFDNVEFDSYVLVCSHIYLDRLKNSRQIPITIETIKVIISVCYSLSLKMHDDTRYNNLNAGFAELLNVPLAAFSEFEVEILNILGHNLYIGESEIRNALSILGLW